MRIISFFQSRALKISQYFTNRLSDATKKRHSKYPPSALIEANSVTAYCKKKELEMEKKANDQQQKAPPSPPPKRVITNPAEVKTGKLPIKREYSIDTQKRAKARKNPEMHG